MIQAEPSFLLFTQEDKWILCSQGGKRPPEQSITAVATQAGRLQESVLVHYNIKTGRCSYAYVYVTAVPLLRIPYFARIIAAALIKISTPQVRRLFDGGVSLKVGRDK